MSLRVMVLVCGQFSFWFLHSLMELVPLPSRCFKVYALAADSRWSESSGIGLNIYRYTHWGHDLTSSLTP